MKPRVCWTTLPYAGTSTGLTFVKINWLPEIEKDFYTELPIKIDVVGDYHQFGNFVSEVAKLPQYRVSARLLG